MKKVLAVLVLASAGCATAGDLYHDPGYGKRDLMAASLVRDEKAVLSEEAIQRLLASRIQLSEKAKLAVFPLEHRGLFGDEQDYGWRTGLRAVRPVEFLQAEKEYLAALEGPLAKTGRFVEVSHMPRLLVPAEPSLTRLRESAALMQADLLLVYRTRCELATYRGFLFFSKDEVAVNSWIELFLLDVRTGVIPYAETFDGLHTEKEEGQDRRIADTQRRAEKNGTLKVVRRAAEGLVDFLGKR